MNSVAFELVRDGFEEEVLRVSSSNRFSLIRNGREVEGSNLGLEVSNTRSYNLFKTIDDLRVQTWLFAKDLETFREGTEKQQKDLLERCCDLTELVRLESNYGKRGLAAA